MVRSSEAFTVVVVVAMLLPGVGLFLLGLAVPLFLHSFPTRRASDLVTTMVIAGAAPGGRGLDRVQVTVVVPVQVHTVLHAINKATWAGSGWLKLTMVAAEGP